MATALCFSSIAWGQSAKKPETALEEITVTAQAREESLQDVPISLTVLTGETLDNIRVDSFYDYTVPGVKSSRAA